MKKLTRREFLKLAGLATAATAASSCLPRLDFLQTIPDIADPLKHYPERDWERVYRDQYRYDSSFTFVCDPNDTHACRLRAYVRNVGRNAVVVRTEQAYDVSEYADLLGNKVSAGWLPRGCLKGYTITRRLYSPYRIKAPMVRQGWKEWVEVGFPTDERGLPPAKYLRRGQDPWVKLSWDEATTLVAKTLLHLMEKYSGEKGAALLRRQGYPEEMVTELHGSGTQTIKIRPGMALLGLTRIHGFYRFANMLALYDGKYGARGWSNYTWHGDLGPGHPMVTGVQTFDQDISDFRNAKLMVFLGKNMVENKMPEAHWWIEIMERGGKIVNVSPEYAPPSQKADYWIPVRPGTDTALLLGATKVILDERLYDVDFVKKFTDMSLLVRLDTLKLLRASDIIPGYKNAELKGYSVQVQKIPPELREEWGDFVVWDQKKSGPQIITREDLGKYLEEKGVDPALEGAFRVKTVNVGEVETKPIFQLYRELCAEYDLDTVADITGAPKELIQQLGRDLGTIKPAMIHTGEGVNHYFHCDITTRAVFLPLALTGNIGKPGGNVGHWAGNYKSAIFDGLPVYNAEDPFNIDQGKVKKYWKAEEVQYWNYGENILKVGGKVFTGKTHMPTPTKVEWYVNVNHINNAKWAYNMIANVHPRVEMIVNQDWEWTGSCEYADVVFPVHSWLELTMPEMTGSCSNPFVQVWKGGIQPLYDSKQDHEVAALVAEKLSRITGDGRYRDYWKYVLDGKPEEKNKVYLQRILDASTTTKGFKAEDMLKSERGWLLHFRTYPRIPGWEQVHESKPFYNKTGRLEFYREEDEFIEYGENLIVHREPVEATPYLPNAIVATHPAIRPNDYGIPLDAAGADERSVRNVKLPWRQVKQTSNPLWVAGYRFYCLTPKTRHRVHSSWSTSDWNMIWDSSFGDPYRMDKRSPDVTEHQMHINPEDGKALGLQNGDYAYVDANPADRPYVGWKPTDFFYKVSRLMIRVIYNPAYPRGVVMIKHAPFMATHRSVQAHESRPDGLARAAEPAYQANLRYGSHQSITRGWLQPTQMTDSLVRKNYYGQGIGQGYELDVHAPNTCPKETMVRITKAEDGGLGGKGAWEPAKSGFSPGAESEAMKRYLAGDFVIT